jgi:hypothetical protein
MKIFIIYMTSIHTNVLSNEELEYFYNHPDVLKAKVLLDTRNVVYFSLPITDLIRNTIQSSFGLNLSVNSLPMRWIKGDTSPHVDVGPSQFEKTYLMYINDSPGEFIIDSQSYPIQSNTGFVFNEGLLHKTENTGNVPRLLIGPMNEFAQPVGFIYIYYYPNEADAVALTNCIGSSETYTVGQGGPFGPYTSWRIEPTNSTGSSYSGAVYVNGDVLDSGGLYYMYPSTPCFLEGSSILCQVDGIEKYVPVETLTKGTLVKTSLHGYKPVVLIGKGTIQNPGDDQRTQNRLYKCSTSNYPELNDDLYITGCHSILVFPATEKQLHDIQSAGKVYVTDKKYRMMAYIDERAEPWNSDGLYTIWHFALEHSDETMNYGVYANGLLVETCSIRFLKNKSNMVIQS